MIKTKSYIVNRSFFGLSLTLKQLKHLIEKRVTKSFTKQTDISLEKYKELFLESVKFKEGYFKVLEKTNKDQLCVTPYTDYDEQYLVLFSSTNENTHTAHYINVQDISLRNNPHVINMLKNNYNFSLVQIEEKNLKTVTISYDLKVKRENLIAAYNIPGGNFPLYVYKTY